MNKPYTPAISNADLDALERELFTITPWPWKECPQRSYLFGKNHEMVASTDRSEGDAFEIRGAGANLPMDLNYDFIRQSPERVAALIKALTLAELHIDTLEQAAIHREAQIALATDSLIECAKEGLEALDKLQQEIDQLRAGAKS